MVYMKNFRKFQSLLAATSKAAAEDSITFHAWERGEISTAVCIKRFRQHNFVRPDADISQIEMEQWLASLGYKRSIYQWEEE